MRGPPMVFFFFTLSLMFCSWSNSSSMFGKASFFGLGYFGNWER